MSRQTGRAVNRCGGEGGGRSIQARDSEGGLTFWLAFSIQASAQQGAPPILAPPSLAHSRHSAAHCRSQLPISSHEPTRVYPLSPPNQPIFAPTKPFRWPQHSSTDDPKQSPYCTELQCRASSEFGAREIQVCMWWGTVVSEMNRGDFFVFLLANDPVKSVSVIHRQGRRRHSSRLYCTVDSPGNATVP